MTHTLKCHPKFFNPIVSGIKTFEFRVHDRPYCVNDTLVLREFHPYLERYSGRTFKVMITYILKSSDCTFPGLSPGYSILSIRPL